MNGIQIFTDGGSRGNPGPGASAYVVLKDRNIIHKGSKFLGTVTNNHAEYMAVILALEWLMENSKNENITKVDFILDSELVVRQLTKIYKVKSPQIKILFDKITDLRKNIPSELTFTSVKRENNTEADKLVNETLDNNTN